MDIQKERELFEELPEIEMILRKNPDIKFENVAYVYHGLNQLTALAVCYVAGAWMAWKAVKAQAVPEGFVLVEREKLAMIFETATNALIYQEASPKHDALSIIQGIARKAMIEAQEQK